MKQTLDNRILKVSEWPPGDQSLWEAAFRPRVSLRSPGNPALKWAADTVRIEERAYGRWLNWLARGGVLDIHERPAARATEARVTDYHAFLAKAGLADYTVAGLIGGLGKALRALEPGADVSWIIEAGHRLHNAARPKREVLSVLRPAGEVLRLGFSLLEAKASDGEKGGSYRSIRFRDGLMIALLLLCPLRRKNFVALELGRHLEKRGGKWRLTIPASETKTGRSINCNFPPMLVSALETYLAEHRQKLLGCGGEGRDTQRLWVSRQGKQLDDQGFYETICKRTEAVFGRAIPPHSFRHLAATTVAELSPADADAIMHLLGHGSIYPSQKYYNRAGALDAVERVQSVLTRMRGWAT